MIHIVDSISSTNNWLAKFHNSKIDTILALKQTTGRGRRGNIWESTLGGLYVSTVYPSRNLLPFIVGISVVKVLENFCADIKLKWPNDIILNDKKLGGILCENEGNCTIIGIGLNLDNDCTVADSISLSMNNVFVDKYALLASFLHNIDIYFPLSSREIIKIYEDYDYLSGKEIFWAGKSGIAKALDFDGSLVVSYAKKEINLYSEEVHLERH